MFAPVVSVATLAGKPANEDRSVTAMFSLVPVGRIHLYAVIDGHGGPVCAAFLQAHLEKYFAAAFATAYEESGGCRTQDSLVCGALRETYRTLDETFRRKHRADYGSGACMLTACLCNGRIYTACVGDCRALLVSVAADGSVAVERLSTDQDCKNATECARVRGRSRDPNPIRVPLGSARPIPRVAGILAVTRAIGDAYLKETGIVRFRSLARFVPYITARPVCTTHRFRAGRDRYLVIGSDGLFNWNTDAEAAAAVHALLSAPGAEWKNAADHLVQRTLVDKVGPMYNMDPSAVVAQSATEGLRRLHDDITAIVVSLASSGAAPDDAADPPPSKRRCIDVDDAEDTDDAESPPSTHRRDEVDQSTPEETEAEDIPAPPSSPTDRPGAIDNESA